MKDFRQLKVWEKAHLLTLKVYELSNHFPKEETFGITSQIRRACASIPTYIAEGCGRNGDAELLRFLSIASGSASELEYLFQLIFDLTGESLAGGGLPVYDKNSGMTLEMSNPFEEILLVGMGGKTAYGEDLCLHGHVLSKNFYMFGAFYYLTPRCSLCLKPNDDKAGALTPEVML